MMDEPMTAAVVEMRRQYEKNRVSLDALQVLLEGQRRANEDERKREFERNCGNLEWMDRMARKQAREELEKLGLHEVAKLVDASDSATVTPRNAPRQAPLSPLLFAASTPIVVLFMGLYILVTVLMIYAQQ